jgi:heat shock protein HspQ
MSDASKPNSNVNDYFPGDPPLFAPGDIVRHRRYGYRGVIVDFDLVCQADEQWYRKNKSQPDRNQPWYHVLVDGSTVVTYAAQSSLIPDTAGQPVHHPIVPRFFDRFEQGRYERNTEPWPGWNPDDQSG